MVAASEAPALLDGAALERALDALGAPAQVEVVAERQALLRFGASRITYQHAEERLRLRARLVRDGRAAWGTVESLDPTRLAALRGHLEALLASLPPSAEGVALPQPGAEARPARTAYTMDGASAEARVALLSDVAARLPAGTQVGGSIAHSSVQHGIASTAGLRRLETRTRAACLVVAEADATADGAGSGGGATRSSYARLLSRDPSALSADAVAALLAPGLAPLPARGLESGTYRALLGPQAVIPLLALLGQVALGAREYAAGQSAFSGRLDQTVLSPHVSLVDNGCDEAGLPATFDCQGTAKQRVPLIEDGVLRGVVTDAATAGMVHGAAGGGFTGHAVPPGWRFGAGPCPSHLLLAAGDATGGDLLAACDRGLWIQRVDYVRTLHGQQTLVTGTTRDATLWVEGGRAVARLPQFRFSVQLAGLFSAVAAVGRQRERGETVFMESVVAPAIVVDAFPVGAVVTRP